MQTIDRFFVITGGPGSGKTSLIEALARCGFSVAGEAGRAIIRQQEAAGGTALPWDDRAAFAEAMLRRDIDTYRAKRDAPGRVFFDRGIPDTIGYLLTIGLSVPTHMRQAAEQWRYNRRVFIAPPWPQIYASDRERRQSLGEAVRTHDAMTRIYSDLGYELVDIPPASVEERVRFICDASR